jgi:hypothetical protein
MSCSFKTQFRGIWIQVESGFKDTCRCSFKWNGHLYTTHSFKAAKEWITSMYKARRRHKEHQAMKGVIRRCYIFTCGLCGEQETVIRPQADLKRGEAIRIAYKTWKQDKEYGWVHRQCCAPIDRHRHRQQLQQLEQLA